MTGTGTEDGLLCRGKGGKVFAVLAFILFTLSLVTTPARADVILPALISDNMVLQQHRQAHLWGWADPEERIMLTVSGTGKQSDFQRGFKARADESGSWQFYLPQIPVGNYSLNIKSSSPFGGGSDITIKNVAVGEVWLAAGQSNMAWSVEQSSNAAETIAAAKHPPIRFFRLKRSTALTPQDDAVGQWVVITPATVGAVSAVAYHFARRLQLDTNVPLGIIESVWSGSKATSWTSLPALATLPALRPLLDEVQRQLDLPEDERKTQPDPPYGKDNPDTPAVLYNAMIAPLHAYTLQGVIWYQGESDVHDARRYREVFPTLIRQWRQDWQQPLPFLFVQLANFEFAPGSKRQKWAELRAAQAFVNASVAATGMVAAVDVGEADNVHPKNKAVVGERLARHALASVYGQNVAYRGPEYQSYKLEPAPAGGQQLRLSFSAARGLYAQGKISAFELADAGSGDYRQAEARIDGADIVLSAEQVVQPGWVRYAWRDNPAANVYNGDHLPLQPFSLQLQE